LRGALRRSPAVEQHCLVGSRRDPTVAEADASPRRPGDGALRLARRKTPSVRFARVSREGRFEFDRAYLDRLASGDPETERHFTRYFGDLLSIKLRSRLRSPAQVDDARQETFVRVVKALRQPGGIQSPGGFGAFVNTVCNNVLFEMYRLHSKTTPLEEEAGAALPDPGMNAEAAVGLDEDRAHVRAVMDTLPQKERQLLHWLFFEEADKDEVCQRLGIDRNYLRVLLHRAKQRFKTEFVGS
jgi:RNA polymerase sigma-70 factor (ECF subfamily)